MIKNISYSFLTQLLPLVVSIILIPMLIKGLGDDRFGLLTLAWVFLGYFSLFNFGIGRATTKYVAEYRANFKNSEIPTLIKTSWSMLLVLGFVGGMALYFLRFSLIEQMLSTPAELIEETYPVFALVALSIPIVIYTTGVRAVLEAYEQFRLLAMISAPAGIMNYIIPFALLWFTRRLDIIVGALLINRLVFLFIHLWACIRVVPNLKDGQAFNRPTMKMLIRFGGWLTISNIIGPLMTYMDRFIVGSMVSLSAVTYYVAPYEMVNRLRIFPNSLMPVMFPAFSGKVSNQPIEAAKLFHQTLKYLWLITIPLMVWISACSYEILAIWISVEFAEQGASVLAILAMGWLINYGAQVAYNWIQSAGHARITALFHLIELPLFFFFAWLLVPSLGIVGVALAWFLRVTIDALLLFGFAWKLLPETNRNLTYSLHLFVLAALLFLLIQFLSGLSSSHWVNVLSPLLALSVYPFLVWFLFLSNEDKAILSQLTLRFYARTKTAN